jgi:hypothetical protein
MRISLLAQDFYPLKNHSNKRAYVDAASASGAYSPTTSSKFVIDGEEDEEEEVGREMGNEAVSKLDEEEEEVSIAFSSSATSSPTRPSHPLSRSTSNSDSLQDQKRLNHEKKKRAIQAQSSRSHFSEGHQLDSFEQMIPQYPSSSNLARPNRHEGFEEDDDEDCGHDPSEAAIDKLYSLISSSATNLLPNTKASNSQNTSRSNSISVSFSFNLFSSQPPADSDTNSQPG